MFTSHSDIYISGEPHPVTNRGKVRHEGNRLKNDLMKKTILIIEDEALVAENLREFVEKSGYEVTDVLSSGEDALKSLTEKPADLVLMDIRLSGRLNGVETIQLIHQTLKKIPVIFLSAYAEDLFSSVSGLSPSLYRYLSKPYKEDELVTVIQQVLG
jgi:CheY-like chemotaxis protein